MREAHTVDQVRAAEAELMARLPAGTLMQRAAAGLAAAVVDYLGGLYGRRILILAGPGDNGGDALLAGARLARRGARVEVIAVADRIHEAGLAELLARGGHLTGVEEARRGPAPQVVLDGILGIGGRPGLRGEAAAAAAAFAGAPTVAVDVPSGVGVDDGTLDGPHVRADLTVAFGTHKGAHLLDPAAEACGATVLVDIGLELPTAPITALQSSDVAALVPAPGPFAHKYTRGVVGIRAGSARYPGAAVLCASGASSGLAGMVRYVAPEGAGAAVADAVRAAHPGVVAGPGRVQAWVVGSGGDAAASAALADALADGVPTVVDADALDFTPTARADPAVDASRPLVLTPHAGELARMLGVERTAVEARQVEHVRAAASRYGCAVLLKGRHTLVADPSGRVRVTTSGLPWLAVAGAGDVLAGVIGSLLAAGLEPFDAASAGSWLHGAAAVLAGQGGPVTPEAVAAALGPVVAALCPTGALGRLEE